VSGADRVLDRPGIKESWPVTVNDFENIFLGPEETVLLAVGSDINEVGICAGGFNERNRADAVEKVLGRGSLGIANVQVINIPIVKHTVGYVWVNTSFAEVAIDIVPALEFGQYCGHRLLFSLGTCG